MKLLFCMLFSILLLAGCASKKEELHPSGLKVIEIQPNKWTALTKQNLLHLAQVYELTPFMYTKLVHIQSKVVPHSHPVLTLNTKNAEHPNKILSTFLHEELHWWAEINKKNTDEAITYLKKRYPKAPAMKGKTQHSTYLHMIVCYLELKALSFYLGKKEARGIISSIMRKDKIYPWIYQQVLYKDKFISYAVKKNKLIPPILF